MISGRDGVKMWILNDGLTVWPQGFLLTQETDFGMLYTMAEFSPWGEIPSTSDWRPKTATPQERTKLVTQPVTIPHSNCDRGLPPKAPRQQQIWKGRLWWGKGHTSVLPGSKSTVNILKMFSLEPFPYFKSQLLTAGGHASAPRTLPPGFGEKTFHSSWSLRNEHWTQWVGAELVVGRSGQSLGIPSVEQWHQYTVGDTWRLGTQDLRKASGRQPGNRYRESEQHRRKEQELSMDTRSGRNLVFPQILASSFLLQILPFVGITCTIT